MRTRYLTAKNKPTAQAQPDCVRQTANEFGPGMPTSALRASDPPSSVADFDYTWHKCALTFDG